MFVYNYIHSCFSSSFTARLPSSDLGNTVTSVSDNNNSRKVEDLTKEHQLTWKEWANKKAIEAKDFIADFVWEAEVCWLINETFARVVWPVLETYILAWVTANPFYVGAYRAFFQGAFMAICKKMDGLGLLKQFLGYAYKTESSKNIKTKIPSQLSVKKFSGKVEWIYKGVIKGVSYFPQYALRVYTGIGVTKAFFGAGIDNFIQNEKKVALGARIINAIKSGIAGGIRKESLDYFTKRQFQVAKTVIVWITANFASDGISSYVESLLDTFGDQINRGKYPAWDPRILSNHRAKSHWYFTNERSMNFWDNFGKCVMGKDDTKDFSIAWADSGFTAFSRKSSSKSVF